MTDNKFGDFTVHSEVQTGTICHDHIWQKTMDLRQAERGESIQQVVQGFGVCDVGYRKYSVLEQKLVCPYCGEEKWEEVE